MLCLLGQTKLAIKACQSMQAQKFKSKAQAQLRLLAGLPADNQSKHNGITTLAKAAAAADDQPNTVEHQVSAVDATAMQLKEWAFHICTCL
jgi:predicted RecB family nuclease